MHFAERLQKLQDERAEQLQIEEERKKEEERLRAEEEMLQPVAELGVEPQSQTEPVTMTHEAVTNSLITLQSSSDVKKTGEISALDYEFAGVLVNFVF